MFEEVTQYLMSGQEGDFIENEDGRRVEIVNMAGGKYLCIGGKGEDAKLVDDVDFTCYFLTASIARRMGMITRPASGKPEHRGDSPVRI